MTPRYSPYPEGVGHCMTAFWRPDGTGDCESLGALARSSFELLGIEPQWVDSSSGEITDYTERRFRKRVDLGSFEIYAGGDVTEGSYLALTWDACVICNARSGDFVFGVSDRYRDHFETISLEMARALVSIKHQVSGGYWFERELKFGPIDYVYGNIATTDEDPVDMDDVAAWGEARRRDEHFAKLRSLFARQILGPGLASLSVHGKTLIDWIVADSVRGELEQIKPDHWIWSISSANRAAVRQQLPSRIIV